VIAFGTMRRLGCHQRESCEANPTSKQAAPGMDTRRRQSKCHAPDQMRSPCYPGEASAQARFG
jgi:hypothetical protein